jgi:hypothetical protein
MLDRIMRWRGTRSAPVSLAEVKQAMLDLTMQYYGADVVLDPHQAVLIAQEARAKGVRVTEFAFSATSVGRLALSLHQAIRQHRIALPPDEGPDRGAGQRPAPEEQPRRLPPRPRQRPARRPGRRPGARDLPPPRR